MNIIAIDPGPKESALLVWDGERVSHPEILNNDVMLETLRIRFASRCVTRDNVSDENTAPYPFKESRLLLEKQGSATDLHEATARLQPSKSSGVPKTNTAQEIKSAQAMEAQEFEAVGVEDAAISADSPGEIQGIRNAKAENGGTPTKVQSLQDKLEQEKSRQTAAALSGSPGEACASQHAHRSTNPILKKGSGRDLLLLSNPVSRQGSLGPQDAADSRRQQHSGERGAGLRAMQPLQREKNRSGISVAIEMIASMGMPVGKEVFETCLMIGRVQEIVLQAGVSLQLVYRREVKMHLCGSMKAKDSNIRQALIDRFGPPGTKNNKGLTYGIQSHLWSALAIAVYVQETTKP